MFTLNSEKLMSRSSYLAERRSADQCELFWHGWKFGWELLPGQRTAGDRPLGVSEAPPVEESVLSWSNSSSLLPPEQTPLPSKPLPFPKLWALKMQPKKCTSVLFRYKEGSTEVLERRFIFSFQNCFYFGIFCDRKAVLS